MQHAADDTLQTRDNVRLVDLQRECCTTRCAGDARKVYFTTTVRAAPASSRRPLPSPSHPIPSHPRPILSPSRPIPPHPIAPLAPSPAGHLGLALSPFFSPVCSRALPSPQLRPRGGLKGTPRVLKGYSRGTQGYSRVLQGYSRGTTKRDSRGTPGVLQGYSRGTQGGLPKGTPGVLKGYSRGTQGGLPKGTPGGPSGVLQGYSFGSGVLQGYSRGTPGVLTAPLAGTTASSRRT